MVIFTKEVEGVILDNCDETIQVDINLVRGKDRRNKSGKPWNLDKGTRGGGQQNIGLEELTRKRVERETLRDLNKTIKKQKSDHYKKLSDRKQERKEKEEANKLKGVEYQVIKNNDKIKKWSKKARDKLMKMPKEMFEEYLKSTKILS